MYVYIYIYIYIYIYKAPTQYVTGTQFMRTLQNGRDHVAESADYDTLALSLNKKLLANGAIYIIFSFAVALL